MYMVQVSDDKKSEMSGLCKNALYYVGKLMSCIEQMGEHGMGERRMDYPMGMRDGGRYGMRDGEWEAKGYYGSRDNDWDEMGERRYIRR